MAGEVEGIVGSLGLFYTTLISGGDRTMIPNNVIMQLAVIPIAEPERVDLKAKFDVSVTPAKLQRMLEKSVTIPLRNPPEVTLEELDGDEITVNIIAVPLNPADGPKLASDVLEAVSDTDLDGRPDGLEIVTDEHQTQGAAPRSNGGGGGKPNSAREVGRPGEDRRVADPPLEPRSRAVTTAPARNGPGDQRQVDRRRAVADTVLREPRGEEGGAVARVHHRRRSPRTRRGGRRRREPRGRAGRARCRDRRRGGRGRSCRRRAARSRAPREPGG